LIEGSLKKDRRDRIGDMAAARFLMSEPIRLSQPPAAASPKPLWAYVLPIAVTALVVLGLTGIGSWLLRTSTLLPVSRSTFVLPEGQNFTGVTLPLIAISSDGSQMAYVANRQLHVRSMSDFDSKAIPGTENALVTSPVFSPDGKSIIFYSGIERAIKRISTGGGTAVTVCPLDNAPYGITWAGAHIAFAAAGKGIMQVPANGGTPEFLVKMDASEIATAPQFLPESDSVLFALASTVNNERQVRWQVVAQSLKTGERKLLVPNACCARYLRTGHIVYASISPLGASLLAVPFDAKHLRLTGEPMQVVEGIRGATANGLAHFSVAETGTLIYIPGRAGVSSEQLDLALVDRKGRIAPLNLPPAAYEQPRLSPDGKKVVYSIYDGKEANIWIYDLSGTSAPRRLTYGGRNRFPIWSGNGERIAFQSDREGDPAIYWQRADISGTAERLTKPEMGSVHIPESWSPNGETILFTVTKDSVVSLWAFSLRDKRATEFGNVRSSTPTEATFSPDGQWVAYITTTVGNPGPYVQPRGLELYVQRFPSNDEKYLISSGTGIHPAWSRNGRELIFNYPSQLMSVSVSTRPVFSFTPPMQFMGGGIFLMPWPGQRSYDVAPDGRLIGTIALRENTIATPPLVPQIRIVVNWFEELKQRVPVH
jgi:Tol biopolymer transport system component